VVVGRLLQEVKKRKKKAAFAAGAYLGPVPVLGFKWLIRQVILVLDKRPRKS